MLTIPCREQASPPRVLLLSQRHLYDQVANSCLYEFEDLIREFDQVDLVSPSTPGILPAKLYKAARMCGVPRPLAGAALATRDAVTPRREYELLIAVLDSYRQVASLSAIKAWRKHCRKAVCFIAEIWPKDFRRSNAILELFDVFDHVFVGVEHAAAPLAKITGRQCSYLPPAVDALRFCPHPPAPRGIDICYIGRRSPITHRALLNFATNNNLLYYYDTCKGGLRVADHHEHRQLLASLIKRSRYFIANYAKIDRPDQTGGMQEVGYRFFEGVAGGAVVLGQPPDTPVHRRLFDWPDAVIEAPFDAPDIGGLIAALDAEPDRLARARTSNVVNTLRRHDWLYRYQQMLAAVGLRPTTDMVRRRQRLGARVQHFVDHHGQLAQVA